VYCLLPVLSETPSLIHSLFLSLSRQRRSPPRARGEKTRSGGGWEVDLPLRRGSMSMRYIPTLNIILFPSLNIILHPLNRILFPYVLLPGSQKRRQSTYCSFLLVSQEIQCPLVEQKLDQISLYIISLLVSPSPLSSFSVLLLSRNWTRFHSLSFPSLFHPHHLASYRCPCLHLPSGEQVGDPHTKG
jgi:hypothetical protein